MRRRGAAIVLTLGLLTGCKSTPEEGRQQAAPANAQTTEDQSAGQEGGSGGVPIIFSEGSSPELRAAFEGLVPENFGSYLGEPRVVINQEERTIALGIEYDETLGFGKRMARMALNNGYINADYFEREAKLVENVRKFAERKMISNGGELVRTSQFQGFVMIFKEGNSDGISLDVPPADNGDEGFHNLRYYNGDTEHVIGMTCPDGESDLPPFDKICLSNDQIDAQETVYNFFN